MFTKDNKYKILEIFLKNPTKEYHIREIARKTKLSPAGTMKILEKLEKQKLLEKNKTRVTTNYKANTENEELKQLKKIYNIYNIHSSGLLKKLIEHYNTPETIILFGSYPKGEDLEKGDIDIAIQTEKQEQPTLEEYEKKLERKINIHTIKEIENTETEFKNTLANGIVLYGYLKVV